jgi:hypothetical protein
MVSLADRSQYLQQFGSDHYAQAFVDFLLGNGISSDAPFSGETAYDLSISALCAIQDNDRARFHEVYERISGRKPKPDSDWLYNDLLMFALVVGAVQFSSDASWLTDALRTRVENTEGESQLIARTLLDAINGNFESTNNHGPLLIVIKHAVNVPLGSPQRINSIYCQLTESTFPLYESGFLNAVSLRAVDVIVLSKELGNLERRLATDDFLGSFTTRIQEIASVMYILLVIAVLSGTLYFSNRYLNAPKTEQGTFESVLALWPFLGVPGLFGLLGKRQHIEAWLKRQLFSFFRYPF